MRKLTSVEKRNFLEMARQMMDVITWEDMVKIFEVYEKRLDAEIAEAEAGRKG